MKIPNRREIQQISHNHSSDIEFKNFMNRYKKCTTKPHSFLVIDDTLASYNQIQIIEQDKFAYSNLGNAFEKQTEKQVVE